MKLRPIGERCLVKKFKEEQKKGSLILLTEKQDEWYEVVSSNNETLSASSVILLAKYAGQEIELDGEQFFIVNEKDIIAVREKERQKSIFD